jgi:hypothetical protein
MKSFTLSPPHLYCTPNFAACEPVTYATELLISGCV